MPEHSANKRWPIWSWDGRNGRWIQAHEGSMGRLADLYETAVKFDMTGSAYVRMAPGLAPTRPPREHDAPVVGEPFIGEIALTGPDVDSPEQRIARAVSTAVTLRPSAPAAADSAPTMTAKAADDQRRAELIAAAWSDATVVTTLGAVVDREQVLTALVEDYRATGSAQLHDDRRELARARDDLLRVKAARPAVNARLRAVEALPVLPDPVREGDRVGWTNVDVKDEATAGMRILLNVRRAHRSPDEARRLAAELLAAADLVEAQAAGATSAEHL